MFSDEDITCPITHEIYIDPVILEGDGYTYERAAIEKWLESNSTSPATGAPIKRTGLIPNYLVRQLADRAAGRSAQRYPKQPLRNNLFPKDNSKETCTIVINESSDNNRQETSVVSGNFLSKVKNIFMYMSLIVLLIVIMFQSKVLTIDSNGLHIGNKKSSSPSYPDLPSYPINSPLPPEEWNQSPPPIPASPPSIPEDSSYPTPEEWNSSYPTLPYSPPDYPSQPSNSDFYNDTSGEWYSPQPPSNPGLYNDTSHNPHQCHYSCSTCDGAGQYDCLTCAPGFDNFILNVPPELVHEYYPERGENGGRGGCFECIQDTQCFDTRTCRENRCVEFWYSDNIH